MAFIKNAVHQGFLLFAGSYAISSASRKFKQNIRNLRASNLNEAT